VRPRRVAPAAVVGGQRPVARAQVGGRHGDRVAGLAPIGLADIACDGSALPARRAVIEHYRAQRRVVGAVPGVVQVAVPARAAHRPGPVCPAVERRRCWQPMRGAGRDASPQNSPHDQRPSSHDLRDLGAPLGHVRTTELRTGCRVLSNQLLQVVIVMRIRQGFRT
jgi:hypothetical protein